MGYLHDMLHMLSGAYNRRDVKNAQNDRPMETNIGRLFSVYAGGLEIVRDEAEKVLLWDNLDNAKGAVLDRYGSNFGVSREGTPDGFYRLLIKTKLLAQLSGGDVNTVIQAASVLLDKPIEDIELDEVFPAKVWIYVDEKVLTSEQMDYIDTIARMLKRIVAAGVEFKLFLRTYDSRQFDICVNTAMCIETYHPSVPRTASVRSPQPTYLCVGTIVETFTTSAAKERSEMIG